MVNMNPQTGIRYSVISGNSLNPDLLDELMFGPDAINETYELCYRQAEEDARQEALAEHMTEDETDDFVTARLEEFSDCYYGGDETFSGEMDGVKYSISNLGGAPLLWVLFGPVGKVRRLCSPCVPNAADCDSGYVISTEPGFDEFDGYECYVPPRDWLEIVTYGG